MRKTFASHLIALLHGGVTLRRRLPGAGFDWFHG